MGNMNENARSDDAKITVTFESASPCFNADNPIVGVVTIDAKTVVPAYSLQATLEQKEHSLFI